MTDSFLPILVGDPPQADWKPTRLELALALEDMRITVGNPLIGGGGISEWGSNANGKYLKYSDGTMICYTDSDFDTLDAINTAPSGVGYSDGQTWTFPAVFANFPLVFGSIRQTFNTVTAHRNDKSTAFYRRISYSGPTSGTFNLGLYAIGEWQS